MWLVQIEKEFKSPGENWKNKMEKKEIKVQVEKKWKKSKQKRDKKVQIEYREKVYNLTKQCLF